MAVLSVPPVINMLWPGQVMNTSFNPLQIVNTYGAFGSVTQGCRGLTPPRAPGFDPTSRRQAARVFRQSRRQTHRHLALLAGSTPLQVRPFEPI